MPERKSHAPGSFCWPEIAAGDAGKAKAFYGELLGWDIRDQPGGFYSIAHRKGKAVAGLYGLMPDQRAKGVPPHWLSYVRVASTDASAQKAAGLGGKVLHPPMDVPGIGRMAVLEDPAGACFALWESTGHEGAELVDEPGAPCWYELMTRDAARAKAFYTGLFGWIPKPMPMEASPGCAGGPVDYTVFHNGESMACGMMEMKGAEWEGVPPHWMPYVAVEDCDSTAKCCAELGGKVCVPPTAIPHIGRFSVLTSPDGAVFSVIRLAGR